MYSLRKMDNGKKKATSKDRKAIKAIKAKMEQMEQPEQTDLMEQLVMMDETEKIS